MALWDPISATLFRRAVQTLGHAFLFLELWVFPVFFFLLGGLLCCFFPSFFFLLGGLHCSFLVRQFYNIDATH
jgi:hypothetical protein